MSVHYTRVHRHSLLFVVSALAFITLILLADRHGLGVQLLLGCATAAFLIYFVRYTEVDWLQIVCAIGIATLGEVALSIGWKLYTYRHAVIPFYVPPGHGLFYAMATVTAAQPWLQRHASIIFRGVLVGGSLLAIVSLLMYGDTWGLVWWLGALVLLRFSRNRLLLSACFCYTIVLEWTGTAIGNWQWAPIVPFLGLHSANPPAGVGILYILVDIAVVMVSVPLAGFLARSSGYTQPMAWFGRQRVQ